jgi:hypothetical protein
MNAGQHRMPAKALGMGLCFLFVIEPRLHT